jgi:hypothetical protein
MARVTVADLRNEARRKLKECGGGKTISRMNRTELIRFLQCIDDRALADTYEQQQADRDYERAQTVPAGFFSEQKPRRKKQKVDDQVTLTRRRKRTTGSGHCMTGAGHMTYRQFIQGALPELRAKGMSSQDAMRAAAALWKRHKMKGGGLKPAGAGLEPAGDVDGGGTAADIAKYSDYTAKALGAASFIPGVGEVAAPAAAAAKGVSFLSSLFE